MRLDQPGPVGDAIGSMDLCGATLLVSSWGMEHELLVGFADVFTHGRA